MCQTPLPMSRREHRAFHTALVSGHRKLTQPRPCVNSAPAPFQLFSVSLHPRCSQPAATTYEINAQLSMSMVAINGFQLLTLTRKAKIFQRGLFSNWIKMLPRLVSQESLHSLLPGPVRPGLKGPSAHSFLWYSLSCSVCNSVGINMLIQTFKCNSITSANQFLLWLNPNSILWRPLLSTCLPVALTSLAVVSQLL